MSQAREAAAVERAVAALPGALKCPSDGRYLVGVSGGRDSMVLLDALVRGGYRRLVVCHLDHGLRGRAGAADARFVERHAARLKLAAVVSRYDVRTLAAKSKISLELAAREARRSFFFAVARTRRCRTLFLAHHADDQVETVLFNLCRGTGATGLAGMLPSTDWEVKSGREQKLRSLRVVRPLLGIWRSQLQAYTGEHGIAYREDVSNRDPAHTRNRLRHEILPALDDVFQRRVGPGIWRAAEIIGAEEAWMRGQLRVREEQVAAELRLPCRELAATPVAEQRRLLRVWLRARGAPRVGYEEVEATRALLDATTGPAKINLPAGLCVRRRAGLLFVEPADAASQ